MDAERNKCAMHAWSGDGDGRRGQSSTRRALAREQAEVWPDTTLDQCQVSSTLLSTSRILKYSSTLLDRGDVEYCALGGPIIGDRKKGCGYFKS